MSTESMGAVTGTDPQSSPRVIRLQSWHRRRAGWLVVWIAFGLLAFGSWAVVFTLDEVARASGVVIASQRVQIIQSVDGGVLEHLAVQEGDRVQPGQVLGYLNRDRLAASVAEVRAALVALDLRAARLRAEVAGAAELNLSPLAETESARQADLEQALFRQRRKAIRDELRTLSVALDLARQELRLTEALDQAGDVNAMEMLQAQRAVNQAEASLVNRRNTWLEEAQRQLTQVEDQIAQNRQILRRREKELEDSVFRSKVNGIVKNIRVTTVGGVVHAGEEILQIVPLDDELIIEARVHPVDIAQVQKGLPATVRFDPFDYTVYGGVSAEVIHVSADTLREQSARGEETYYRVYLRPDAYPVRTRTGRSLPILPGMTAQIDIRTGERTLSDYLLKPLRRVVGESLTER